MDSATQGKTFNNVRMQVVDTSPAEKKGYVVCKANIQKKQVFVLADVFLWENGQYPKKGAFFSGSVVRDNVEGDPLKGYKATALQ